MTDKTDALVRWAELCEKGHGHTVALELREALAAPAEVAQGDEMVSLLPGLPSLPRWLLDAATRIDRFMASQYPGPWEIMGVRGGYPRDDPPPAASVDVEELRKIADGIDPKIGTMGCAETARRIRALIDSAGGAKGECCVPDAGEPSFVFLGRDPQAPALVEQWADERERAEPDSAKPAAARDIARRMREFKNANPDKGMPASAVIAQPAEGEGAVAVVVSTGYPQWLVSWLDSPEYRQLPTGTKLYTRPAATAVVAEGYYALIAKSVLREWGKLDEVREACRFETAPAAPKGVDGVEQLTEQQAVIVTGYTGTLCGSFGAFHADLEKRAGRSVFTHEMSDFGWIKSLYRDDFIALAGQHGGPHDGR